MNEIVKCPKCGNEGKQGYIFSPRRICWSDSGDSIIADLESEILIKDAIFRISKTPAFRCENCNLVIFEYN